MTFVQGDSWLRGWVTHVLEHKVLSSEKSPDLLGFVSWEPEALCSLPSTRLNCQWLRLPGCQWAAWPWRVSSSPRHAGAHKPGGYVLPCERGREDECPKKETMVTLGKVVNLTMDSYGGNTGTKKKNLWNPWDKFWRSLGQYLEHGVILHPTCRMKGWPWVRVYSKDFMYVLGFFFFPFAMIKHS